MNNANDFTGALTVEEYEALIAQRDEIDRIIQEFEREYRRGNVKVFEQRINKRGVTKYSLRYNSWFNKNGKAYWKTIATEDTKSELLDVMKMLAEDIPAVYEAYKEKEAVAE